MEKKIIIEILVKITTKKLFIGNNWHFYEVEQESKRMQENAKKIWDYKKIEWFILRRKLLLTKCQ